MNTTNADIFFGGVHICTITNVTGVVQDHDKGSGCHLVNSPSGEFHAWCCEIRLVEEGTMRTTVIPMAVPTDITKLDVREVFPFKDGIIAGGVSTNTGTMIFRSNYVTNPDGLKAYTFTNNTGTNVLTLGSFSSTNRIVWPPGKEPVTWRELGVAGVAFALLMFVLVITAMRRKGQ